MAVEYLKDQLDSLPQWAKFGLGVACAAVPVVYVILRRPRKSPVKEDWKKDVIYLYQFPRPPCVPNLSPFAMKVETWLRMVGLKDQYEVMDSNMWIRSKEGKLPFVEVNGKEICDSSFIIRDLTKMFGRDSYEAQLTTEAKGAARALEQMTENSLLLSYAYVRYGEHAEDMFSDKVMGPDVPFFLRKLAPWFLSRKVKANLAMQGIGLHERKEIIGIGLDDLKAISNYLGGKLYLTGDDKPTRADATVFSVVSQILYVPIDTDHKKFIEAECRNLVDYCARIKQEFWPDWDDVTKAKKK